MEFKLDPDMTPQMIHMIAIEDTYKPVAQFLEWLHARVDFMHSSGYGSGYECDHSPDERTDEQLLAEYFGINLEELEKEKEFLINLYTDHLKKR